MRRGPKPNASSCYREGPRPIPSSRSISRNSLRELNLLSNHATSPTAIANATTYPSNRRRLPAMLHEFASDISGGMPAPAPIIPSTRRAPSVDPLARGARRLLGLLDALAVDLLLVDLLGLGKRLLDLRHPALLEDGDDAGRVGRQDVLELLLDLVFAVVRRESADPRAGCATDHGGRDHPGREDQPEDETAERAHHA